MDMTYALSGGLSVGQLDQCREMAAAILSEIGVQIDDADIRQYLGRHPGVRVDGNRLFYGEEILEEAIRQQGLQNAEYVYRQDGDPDFAMRPSYLCLKVYDPISSDIHTATAEDLIRAVRLCESLGMVGASPLHPQDVPAPLRQIETTRLCIENSRGVGNWAMATNVEEIRCIVETATLAGRTPPFVALQITISPLRLNTEYIDLIWRLRDSPDVSRGIAIGGGAMPMMGATGPLSIPAAWAQGLAECIAGYATAKLVNPHVLGYASFRVDQRVSQRSFALPGDVAAAVRRAYDRGAAKLTA